MRGWKGRSFWRLALTFLIFCFSWALVAQTPVTGNAAPSPAKDSKQDNSSNAAGVVPNQNLELSSGDLIEINVFGVPELTTRTRVSSSGEVYLPLIDYVHVAGLTADEAQELIQKRLEDGGFVRNPHVSIFVTESASQGITVVGEVNHPGTYPAIGDRKLFDLISAAGGLSDKAGRAVTIVHRDNPEDKVTLQLSVNLAEDAEHNVEIRPGDTIIVSRAGIIYVVGDVNRPSGFMIEDNSMTVLKALALAGGSTKTSSLNKTRILRQKPDGGIQEIPVPLKKILYAKMADIPLDKGDVLFVPSSAAKSAAYQTAAAAMSISTALAVVAVE
jgi:polysaccharide biosynthesis/export protein